MAILYGLLFGGVLFAQAQVQQAWVRTYDTPQHDFAAGLVVDAQSNVCVLVDSIGDFTTLKYSPGGTLLWADTYDSSRQDIPTALAVDAAGNLWATGISTTNDLPGNIVTIKYAPNGSRLWVRTKEETNATRRYPLVTPDGMGGGYIAGSSIGDGESFVAIRYDSDGAALWVRRYAVGAGHTAEPSHAAVDQAGNLIVVGSMRNGPGPTRLVLLKYDPSGNVLTAAVNEWQTNNDFLTGATSDAEGNVYVVGAAWRGAPIRYHFFTAKYNSSGALVWSVLRPPANGYHAIPHAVKLDSEGNIIMSGDEHRPVDEDDYEYSAVTIKYAPDGSQLWSGRSTFQRIPQALAVDGAGNIYVAGYTEPYLSPIGTFLLKYAPNGSQEWYTELSSMPLQKFALAGSGDLYLTDITNGASWALQTRKFVQTPVTGQPTATIVPALTEVFAGSSVTLTAAVSGAGPFTYHWLHFGYYTGVRSATFTIPNVQYEWQSQGDYSVIVSNATAYTISPEARVSVLRPPLVRLQVGTNQYASVGQQAIFSAYAVGTEPFSFQWCFNGNPISGATGNVFTLASAQVTNAGNYTVVVTNRAGMATSDVVRLVLVLPPVSATNATSIQISSNSAMPYPSEIFVQVVTGNVLKVTATLCGFTHPYPDQISVLLQGPMGQSVMLMSEVADCATANNVTLTFDDEALDSIPREERIFSGTFKPSNYGVDEPLPPPAPVEWDSTLSVFSGLDPNGTWRLFVANIGGEQGEFACGWHLAFLLADPNAAGSLFIKSIERVGDRIWLRWDGAPTCKLQRSSSFTNPAWSDVPGSEGQSSIELPMGSNSEFFRLKP